MNSFLNEMKSQTNYTYTLNGAVTHRSTLNKVLDMFALCGAYRNRSIEDCINAFESAYFEDDVLALKCLFYLRDCRGGQGERRFFRVCFNWLAKNFPEAARRNLPHIAEYGRYDDIFYSCIDTPIEKDALDYIQYIFKLDLDSKTPSLLAKWLPSENASSPKTKAMARRIKKHFGMTHKEYRQALSTLRQRINIVERLMSQGRWDEIEFDKIPSKAGLIYKNAFARRDMIAKKYETFAKSENTTVNAATLNPVDIAEKIFNKEYSLCSESKDNVDRLMFQKYWDNLKDYYNGREENGISIVDVSGSMSGRPLYAAVSMGAYIAERGHGPFANHFITFSDDPELVKFEGVDICDKFWRARRADWEMSTNLEAVFNLLLTVIKSENTRPEDIPARLYIFSDMQFNQCIDKCRDLQKANTLVEGIAEKWKAEGYELPQVIFWNLNASTDNIPALGDKFNYVSGNSMNMIEQILSGKTGIDLMLAKLLSDRYSAIQ